ncbi:hypothetical protein LY76DRAFT_598369 [Colletotrichum caudatum]|nr:hypothetical protein LY76DRAFT_598369 [Colletotrichum caudatum]
MDRACHALTSHHPLRVPACSHRLCVVEANPHRPSGNQLIEDECKALNCPCAKQYYVESSVVVGGYNGVSLLPPKPLQCSAAGNECYSGPGEEEKKKKKTNNLVKSRCFYTGTSRRELVASPLGCTRHSHDGWLACANIPKPVRVTASREGEGEGEGCFLFCFLFSFSAFAISVSEYRLGLQDQSNQEQRAGRDCILGRRPRHVSRRPCVSSLRLKKGKKSVWIPARTRNLGQCLDMPPMSRISTPSRGTPCPVDDNCLRAT